MNAKITLTILVAGLVAAGSTTSFGQTNIPTGEDSVITGTFKAGPTTVIKGVDANSSALSTAINIAATVRQVAEGIPRTNSSGFVTKKDSFKVYAFGNKEILQLSLSTNKITGYALAYTNPFINNPLDGGAFLARGKTTNFPVSTVTLNAYAGLDVYANDIDRKTNWSLIKKYNYDGYIWTAADLGRYTNLPVFASYKIAGPKTASFQNGTNRTTGSYYTISVNGNFSGIVPAAD